MRSLRSVIIVTALLGAVFVVGSSAQKQYEGYSLDVDANNGGSCPIQYLPSAGGGNAIQVFVAGTNQQTPAGVLKACDGGSVVGNRVSPNNLGKWCFTGSEDLYEIKLTNGKTYLWPPLDRESGFYNVRDFRPVKYYPQAAVKYERTEPADYTQTIRNAITYIAARQGGTLYFPDGDYVVGTLDGNRRDPSYEALTLPSGIVIQGTSSSPSVPGTNLPFKVSATRIRLRNDKQSIFRIGGCTANVTVRDIELLGNAELFGEAKRPTGGTYGIEAMGKWAIDPKTGAVTPNSSQLMKFEGLSIQNFERGIYAHNANDKNCNAKEQGCGYWQFDYVIVNNVFFSNNGTGIWIDTFNTDWKVSSSFFNYHALVNPPGDGIRLQKATSMLIEQSFGGGTDYGQYIGGTFLNIDYVLAVTVISSSSERGQRGIYTNPLGSISSTMLTVIGSGFTDKVELNGRLNYVSTGNTYLPNTLQAGQGVNIVSSGDRFCPDPDVTPQACVDQSGKFVNRPQFNGGKIIFQTGRRAEGSGAYQMPSTPTFFGHQVEMADDDSSNTAPMLFSRSSNFNKPLLRLGQSNYFYDFQRREHNGFLAITGNQDKPYRGLIINGPIQFDPNITFQDIQQYGSVTVIAGQPVISDGALVYCKDCRKSPTGVCTQGTAGVDGGFAKRINKQWRCD
ncbi:MAG: hypothetical protein ABI791_11870 [Acidobacteriota bacterium]